MSGVLGGLNRTKRGWVCAVARAFLGVVLHQDDHVVGTVDEIHGAALSPDHLPGDHPVREVSVGGDLCAAEDGGVDLPAANHSEAQGGIEEGRR